MRWIFEFYSIFRILHLGLPSTPPVSRNSRYAKRQTGKWQQKAARTVPPACRKSPKGGFGTGRR
ncbi:hypothetical protein CBM2633_A70558 [Cupriavidus taiwanensis]|uniref:Uncharacterized protein n=1 Tax=Cupriavidus taiwanensis TaxID=164546 RepID=A0A375E0G0_9BURK|nr:hypothetical protein CBM2604_A100112 [Cupriavidus taiwanensis]SOZ23820.1 hypothetical protein CBM2609_A120112 [Cupriavidus taiwanensis]SOZ54575.1 hypothetical protein CBM2615_A250005 [Cupriavidus taiwanensis]SOZ55218.1 hypothetical protein CBM2614_A220005 [Cupriavidus taiwanensis]SOZ57809.1 hypothetical protein CBM2613_A230005 [Cupriavidus taiwanensis]